MVGEILGNYRLLKELGQGTYGTVYLAEHKDMAGIKAAVKVVHPALATDPVFVSSIRSECQILHGLTHPNIVSFKDLIVAPGNIAMVLEFLDGMDLHDAIVEQAITKEDAGHVLEQVLEGLAYAHDRGVVHRDIKPGNIFLCADGTLKLLDFGIAKAAGGTRATKTGTIAGTLDYMPPEAFDGITGPRIDLYAAGLVAWEIYMGHPACPDATPMRKMKWHIDVGVPDLWKLDPQAPEWLRDLILQLTNRDPDVRPKNGWEALVLLRGAEREPAEVPKQGATPPPTRWVARQRRTTGSTSAPSTGPDVSASHGTPGASSVPPAAPADEPPTSRSRAGTGRHGTGPGVIFGSLVVAASTVLGLTLGLTLGIALMRLI